MVILEGPGFRGEGSAPDSVEATVTKEAKFVVRDGGRGVQMLGTEVQVKRKGIVPCPRIPAFVDLGN